MEVGPLDRRSRLDFLDSVTALAALYVLACHCWFVLCSDMMNRPPRGWPPGG